MISHKSSTFHKATLFSLLFLASFLLFARSGQAQVATLFASPSGVSSGVTTALTWACPGGTSSATLNPPGFVVGLNGTQNSAVLTNNSIFSIVCAFVPVPISAYTTVNVSGTGGQSCNSGTPVGGACGPAGDVCYGNSLWQCWSSAYPVVYLNSNPGSVTYTVGGSAPPPQSFAISNLNSSNSTAYWSASSDQSWCHVAGPANPPSFVYSGSSSFGSPANITLYIDPIVTPGTYTCHVTFTNWFNAPNNAAISNVPYTYTLNYTVLAAAVPVVTITANPTSGTVGVVNPSLTWSATNNPTSCTASGDWSGAKATSGNNVSQGVLNSVKTYNYVLTCSNAGGSSNPASATVVVSAAPTCPSGPAPSVILGSSSILVGGGTTATAPAGFSGGSFFSTDSTKATATGGNGSTITGVGAGSANITGAGWNYSNGATGCFLAGAPITVTSPNVIPTITSPTATSITTSGATLGATVTSLGTPATLTARGVCYSTDPALVTGVICVAATLSQTVPSTFTVSVSGLAANTTYYYIGYATNSTGTGYTAVPSFTTSSSPINGTCGTANGKAYPNGTASYGSDTQCATGNSSNTSFPTAGNTVTWQCSGQNGGALSPVCSASQNNAQPDLTAAAPTPNVAVAGTPLQFSSVITNGGGSSTGASFSNLFQVATAAQGGGSITTLSVNSLGTLGGGASGTVTSSFYTFPSAGTYSVRACADNDASMNGTIPESNEGNNCGSWTDVTVSPASACVGAGSGTGLTGQYYDGISFGSLVTTRTDSTIDFNPADFLGVNYANSPDGDTFSVKWTGQVQANCSEDYIFYTNSDDGAALWVNGNQVINQWVDQAPTEIASAPITLVAGTKYTIEMDYYENIGGAVAQLSWSSPTNGKQIIPQTQLFPAAANAVPTVTSPTATSITSSGATLGANVTSLGVPASITARGTCWDTTPAPVANCIAEGSVTTGVYTQTRSGMPANTTVYYRGYATNSTGTGYSADGSFTTSATAINGTCGSANGKVYPNGTGSYGADTQCSNGNSSDTSFPTAGNTVTWQCSGQNGGSPSPVCSASQNAPLATYTLTVNKSVGGTVSSSVGGISCGSTCSQSYTSGTVVLLTATPASSYWKFIGWTGDCTGTSSCTLTVNSAKTVSAVFAPVPFQYQEF